MSSVMRMQRKQWMFTLYQEDRPVFDVDHLVYLCGNPEICPKTGRFHWQCYVQTKNRIRPGELAKLLCIDGAKPHWDPVNGTPEEARTYCQKEETRAIDMESFEYGEFQKTMQGKRSDLLELAQRIVANPMDFKEIVLEAPDTYVRNYRGLMTLRNLVIEKPREPVDCTGRTRILIGPSGCGKSKWVFDEVDPLRTGRTLYVKSPTTKWWDGYMGQDCVLIDEFRGKIALEDILMWTDTWYPCQVETKGGWVQLQATRFFICSNNKVKSWWPEESIEPLLRRSQTYDYEEDQ